MKHIAKVSINILIIITLLLPFSFVDSVVAFSAKDYAFAQDVSGLFRVTVNIQQAYDLVRIKEMGVTILEETDEEATLLVSSGQLETLAKLGYRPQTVDDLISLVSASAESYPWLALGLRSSLEQAAVLYQDSYDSSVKQVAEVENELLEILSGLSMEQLNGIMYLPGVDSDADGLTDTQESWWCTDPMNPDSDGDGKLDGIEITAIKDWMANKSAQSPGETPWASWPFNSETCPDKDFDSIPNLVEKYELGLNMDLESTDRDRYDDGQEVFGVTYCPGSGNSCGYGILPASNHDGILLFPQMPSWVTFPGHHPTVAAYPKLDFNLVEDSTGNTFKVQAATTITTEKVTLEGETKLYSTTKLDGTNTQNDETTSIENFEEYSETTKLDKAEAEEYLDSEIMTTNISNRIQSTSIRTNQTNNTYLSIVNNEAPKKVNPKNNYLQDKSTSILDFGFNAIDKELGIKKRLNSALGATAATLRDAFVGRDSWDKALKKNKCQPDGVTLSEMACRAKSLGTMWKNNYDDRLDAATLEEQEEKNRASGDSIIADGDELGFSRVFPIMYPVPSFTPTKTQTTGTINGRSQTTSHGKYQEHSVTEGSEKQFSTSWAEATAVNTVHAADLWFAYTISNIGTDYARQICNIAINVYIGDEKVPAATYYPGRDIGGEGCFTNFEPGEEHTFSSNSSKRIELTLEQLKAIDTGAPVQFVIEDYSLGQDDFYISDSVFGNLTLTINDGIEDGDDTYETYLLAVNPGEKVLDTINRFFPVELDDYGMMVGIWTPELSEVPLSWCDAPINVGSRVWCKHSISASDWWSVFTDGLNYEEESYQGSISLPGSIMIWRFNQDTDHDGFSDSSEEKFETDKLDPTSFPTPELIGGIHNIRIGDEVVSTLSLLNTGVYDAYGIEAIMIAQDDTVSIIDNTIGGSGRVRSARSVIVGSQISPPELIQWNGSAKPIAKGYYTGTTDNEYVVSVNCDKSTGCILGEDALSISWSDSTSNSGVIEISADYATPSLIDLGELGIKIGFGSGNLINSDNIKINARFSRDTFKYKINSDDFSVPIVLVTYNDPQGKHIFYIPQEAMSLQSPDQNLIDFSETMIESIPLSIPSVSPINPGQNHINVLFTNPLNRTINDGFMVLNILDASGEVVYESSVKTNLYSGPNLIRVDWSTNDFSPLYIADNDYLVLAYCTDHEGNILDVIGRPFSSFITDPAPMIETSLPGNVWNIGHVQKGKIVQYDLIVANTGYAPLSFSVDKNTIVDVQSENDIETVSSGSAVKIPVVLDTAAFSEGELHIDVPIRTNDPLHPTINITVKGNIITPSVPIVAIEDIYKPLQEVLFVNRTNNSNFKVTYSHGSSISENSNPMFFTNPSSTIVGYGEPFMTLDPSVVQGEESSPAVDAALVRNEVDLTGATELEEYRTETSSVYIWPDGRGKIIIDNLPQGENETNERVQVGVRYDAYVNSTYPNTATWNQALLWMGNNPGTSKANARVLIWFNLPSLPAHAIVDSSLLAMHTNSWYGTNTINTQVFRITGNWTQGNYEPTWNNHPPVDWGTVWNSTDLAKNKEYKYWNITNLVRSWYSGTPNYGMVVRANPENANGFSFYAHENLSNIPQLIIDFHIPPPPTAPTLYAISNADADGNYTVDWSDTPNTTSYQLEENLNGGAFSSVYNGGASIYNATNKGVGYRCYRVRAVNAYGTSGYSGTQCTTINPAPDTPVINPIENEDGNGDYSINWSSVQFATSYELQESLDSGVYNTVYSGASLSHSVTNRAVGQWCYRVRALNASGTGSWSVNQCVMVNVPPNPPALVTPGNGSNVLGRAVAFAWEESTDEDNFPGLPMEYIVRITPSKDGQVIESPILTETQWVGVVPTDGEYTWRVKAYDGRSWGEWSVPHSFGVFSIAREDSTHTQIAIPDTIDDYAYYHVKYGLRAHFTAEDTPQVIEVKLPKRLYSSVTFDILLKEASQGNVSLAVDIGNDGSVEWNQEINWTEAVSLGSTELAEAINAIMIQSPIGGGELVTIPIKISLSSLGDLYLYNLVSVTGVDSDPMVGVGDITISKQQPVETETIGVNARVHNIGIFNAKNLMVTFYVGDPNQGGRYIGSKLVPSIHGGSFVDAEIQWNTSGYTGDQTIHVVLDRANQIQEMDESNNSTSAEFYVLTRPDLKSESHALSNPEPVQNETVSFSFALANGGEADSTQTKISVYDGEKSLDGTFVGEGIADVIGQSFTQMDFDWTPTSLGLHRLFVYADVDEEISEFDESNNVSWLDVFVGLAGPIKLDSGTASDPVYVPETGYGYIDINQPDESVSCGNQPEQSMRRDPDGEIVYKFDHLLPGHFYHLDITLFECDGAGRQQTVLIDDNQIAGPVDLGDGEVHRLSIRIDPAFYADREVKVSIKAEGIDGAVVSEVNLFDIDYRYADAGGGKDPQYPGEDSYGWLDGSAVTAWGTLPYQSVRVDQTDSELRYRFDKLDPDKRYNVHFTFWQPSGSARMLKVQVDGVDTDLMVNTGDYLRHQESLLIPVEAYSQDGSVVVSIIRTNASTGAMVNEIALEEETLSMVRACNVSQTPYFSETYGDVLIENIGAPVGSLVEAISPRGDTVGCFVVENAGSYGFLRIYGEDTTADPIIPGMRAGEIVTYRVNGATATANPSYYWQDDHASHKVDLNAGSTNTQSILLQSGWNLISFNVEPPTSLVPTVLQSIVGKYDRVLGEEGVYVPTIPHEFNTLKELHSSNGYYVRVNGTTSVSLLVEGIQQPCDRPKELHAGWNWIGAPCSITPTPTALASIEGKYLRIMSLSKTYDPALPDFSTLLALTPGEGYLIFVQEPVTLVYPTGKFNVPEEDLESLTCEEVRMTPFSTIVYGNVNWMGTVLPEGSVVQFITPRGEVAGCTKVLEDGKIPLTQVYGSDDDELPGFREGEILSVKVNGLDSMVEADIVWFDDKDIHFIDANVSGYLLYLPMLTK